MKISDSVNFRQIKAFLITFVIMCIGATLLLCYIFAPEEPKPEPPKPTPPPHIIYVHGWNPLDSSQDEVKNKLREIFPNSKVDVVEWETPGIFDDSVDKADNQMTGYLIEKIESMPIEERRNVILIGHSLGGRIVIKAMAQLSHPIRAGYFLAAAIPNDDPNIALAIKNSLKRNLNIVNTNDLVLTHAYREYTGTKALGGCGYAKEFSSNKLSEFKVAGPEPDLLDIILNPIIEIIESYVETHHSMLYLGFLKDKLGR